MTHGWAWLHRVQSAKILAGALQEKLGGALTREAPPLPLYGCQIPDTPVHKIIWSYLQAPPPVYTVCMHIELKFCISGRLLKIKVRLQPIHCLFLYCAATPYSMQIMYI